MRVAVSQFATTLSVEENLATCLRMINEAARCKPALIVLPELCNAHSWFVDHNSAWDNALTIDGDFLQAIAIQAKAHNCYISLAVSLRRDLSRDHQNGAVKSNISISSCLFSPLGELILQLDKQTLLGHEHEFFISAAEVCHQIITKEHEQLTDIAETTYGTIGLLTGNDNLRVEPAKNFVLHGAQLLCQSLNSFALDHSTLHSPARACDNKVFIATANKTGTLLPDEHSDNFSENYFIPEKYLVGAGESQIISPEGQVLAKIDNNEEGFTFADIDLSKANQCTRPDGTDMNEQRRPELYQALQHLPQQTLQQESHLEIANGMSDNPPVTANVAIFATYKSNEQAIEDVCHYIENNLTDIIQLPELFFVSDKESTHDPEQRNQIACLSESLIEQVSAVLRPFQYVCTSLVIEGNHQAVLISENGVIAKQQQLHFCQRYQWTALGDELSVITLPLEQGSINLVMLTGDDANIPEIVKVSALKGIHLLLVPFDIQEAHEVTYSLLSRAVENRICIVAASREKSFADGSQKMTQRITIGNVDANTPVNGKNKKKVKLHKSTGLIANLTTDFTLFTQWHSRKFDGTINSPLVKYQFGKITKALVHPNTTKNKLLTSTFDLLIPEFKRGNDKTK